MSQDNKIISIPRPLALTNVRAASAERQLKKRVITPAQRARANELRRIRRAGGPGKGLPGQTKRPSGLKRFYAALTERSPGEVDLTGLRRFARKDGGSVYISKAVLWRRRKLRRAQMEAQRKAKAKRKREWAKRIAKRIGKGRVVKLQAATHRGTGESRRQPVGVYETDRQVLAAMGDGWYPKSVAKSNCRDVFAKRLLPAGLVEWMDTGGVVSPGRPRVFWRLTAAGKELRSRLERGILPARVAVRRFIPLEVGEIPGHRQTLCRMTPGAWQTVRDICGGQSSTNLWWRTRGSLLRFLKEGLAERVVNEEVLGWWEPGENGMNWPVGTEKGSTLREERARRMSAPRLLWRLTERGVELREQFLREEGEKARAENA